MPAANNQKLLVIGIMLHRRGIDLMPGCRMWQGSSPACAASPSENQWKAES